MINDLSEFKTKILVRQERIKFLKLKLVAQFGKNERKNTSFCTRRKIVRENLGYI